MTDDCGCEEKKDEKKEEQFNEFKATIATHEVTVSIEAKSHDRSTTELKNQCQKVLKDNFELAVKKSRETRASVGGSYTY